MVVPVTGAATNFARFRRFGTRNLLAENVYFGASRLNRIVRDLKLAMGALEGYALARELQRELRVVEERPRPLAWKLIFQLYCEKGNWGPFLRYADSSKAWGGYAPEGKPGRTQRTACCQLWRWVPEIWKRSQVCGPIFRLGLFARAGGDI